MKQRWIHPGENQCSWVLRQEDWFVVRGGEMERIRATAVWGSEHGPSSIDPVLTLMLDGRVYVIARPECFEGCGGAVIVEVRGTKILPAIDAATDAVCG